MVRCKFYCASKQESLSQPGKSIFSYKFSAVISGSEENKTFFAYTPAGLLSIDSVNDGNFEVGKEYYLDIVST